MPSTVRLSVLLTFTNLLNLVAFPGYHNLADGKFATAKILVPKCLDMCDTPPSDSFSAKLGSIWMPIGMRKPLLIHNAKSDQIIQQKGP